MVVKINIETGERTVINPLNEQDQKTLRKIIFELYLLNEQKGELLCQKDG
jgi:hypothetical protein